MRTGTQQRYYDILRREDHRRPQMGSAVGSNGDSIAFSSSHLTQNSRHKRRGSQQADTSRSAYASFLSPSLTSWDPIEQLHLTSTTVAAMRELACDHRNLTSLHPNFMRFEQLDSLVLNHNALRTLRNLLPPSPLSGLSTAVSSYLSVATPTTATSVAASASLYRGCRRLTRLHVSHNELRDLARDTDIPQLLLLEHLSLAQNQLTDLDYVLQSLRRLRHLRYVDLRGNPIVDEPFYRPRCITALPQVEVLDGQMVTADERRNTAAIMATGGFLKSRLHGTLAAAATTTTTTSSDSDSIRPCDTKIREKKTRTGRFAKSAIAQDLDIRYITHLKQQQQDRVAAAAACAAAERQKEEMREAFHAVWALSQPGMPLSEEGWRTTMTAAGVGTPTQLALNNNGGGADSLAAAAGSVASRPGRKPQAQQQQQQSSSPPAPGGSTSRPRTPVLTRSLPSQPGTALDETGTAGAAVRSVEVPRERLLPLIPSSQPQQQRVEINGAPHDSPYFRIVRGKGKANAADFATALSDAACELPPVRLLAIQHALQASTEIIRAANGSDVKEAAEATYHSSGRVDMRKPGEGSLIPGSTTMVTPTLQADAGSRATFPADIEALRVIQQNKYALIPPPWEAEQETERQAEVSPANERSRSDCGAGNITFPSSIGHAQKCTVIQEALVEVLVLLHQLFSAEELQSLEMEYGRAELLRLLPLPEWSVAWEAAAEGTAAPLNTLCAARQEMLLLLRPGTAVIASRGSSGNSTGNRSRLGGEERKRGGGGGKGGGAPGSISVSTSSLGAIGMGGPLSVGEVAVAAMCAARAAVSSEPGRLWDMFLHAFTGGAAPRQPHVSQGRNNEVSVSAMSSNSNNSSGVGASATAATPGSAAAGGASVDEVNLQDPEVVQQLVRPVGPYEGRVLGSFLKLLKPPPSLYTDELCEGIRAFHSAMPHISGAMSHLSTAGATATTTTAATQEASRGGATASKSKKEAATLSTTETEGNETKKRLGRGNAHHPSALANHATASGSVHEQPGWKQQPHTSSLVPQLSLISILTALLFHPTFVRARLQYWEQELMRVTAATAAAPTVAAIQKVKNDSPVRPGSPSGTRAGTTPSAGAAANISAAATAAVTPTNPVTPLSRLFHRVQELKTYVARVDKAAAAESTTADVRPKTEGLAGEAALTSFVSPFQVLAAYR